MLATKFTFTVTVFPDDAGGVVTVTRLSDNAVKKFPMVRLREPSGMEFFMSTLTDDQMNSFFPK